ncbi:Hypothetical protein I5071_58200 [Sandaracinus amylolyticus]|nr:Hypothetical protein I5071_58200 [Sandaracinus amylolyticus]
MLGASMSRSRFFVALHCVLVLTACNESSPPADDAGTDALVASELFGPCVEDSQCPGEGAVCRRDDHGFPGGHCSVPCDDRTPCDAFGSYHHCVRREGETQSYCEQRCRNGLDCGRVAYTCAGELPPSGGVCIGVCSSDAECSTGYTCERNSAQCVPAGTSEPSGAAVGEPCGGDDECRSAACLLEANGGTPSGFVGGSCIGRCILPAGYNSNFFFSGPVLPRAGCAGETDVCFPDGSLTEGDLGVCLDGCTSSADCRPGYACRQTFQTASSSASFENGVCLPIDCASTACPTGYQCRQVPRSDGSVSNVCGR